MEKPKLLHVLLLLVTFLQFSNSGEAKGEVDMDMLNKLKDSGALDNIKEELEKMLDAKEAAESDVPVAKAYEYLKGFVEQKGLKLPEGLLKALVNMPSTSDSPYLHLVALTDIAESINSLLTKGAKHDEKLIIQISEKLIEMATKFKSLEEFRDTIRAQQEAVDKKFNNVKTPTADDLKSAAEMVKKDMVNNPYKNILSGGLGGLTADNIIQGIELFFGLVKSNPDITDQITDYICNYLEGYEFFSKKTLNMVRTYAKNFAKTDYFTNGIEQFGGSIIQMVNTKGGRKMLEIIPTLANADSREAVTDLFKGQLESQWENFFNAINNSDLRNAFLVKIATTVEYIYSKILMDDMKMMMANAFLLTQNLPPITPRRLLPSIVDLVGKSIKVFSALDVDLAVYENLAKEISKQFADEYVNANQFSKLKEDERIRLITRFLEENVVVGAQELWTAHQHVFGKVMPIMALDSKDKTPRDINRNLHCAENLICNINAHARKEPSMIRRTTSKTLSLAISWTWSMAGLDLDQLKLYTALHNGADIFKGIDCDEKYPVSPPNSCKIFDWQRQQMSLSFDSNELPPEVTQEKPPRHEEL